MPTSFIRSTIDFFQSSFSELLAARPSRIAATSTAGAAAAVGAGGVAAAGAEVDAEGVGAADIVPLGATVEVTGLPPDAGAGAAWPNIFDIRLVNIPITRNSKAGQMKLPALLLLLNPDGRIKVRAEKIRSCTANRFEGC
jgi:hypothetical protein